MAWRQCCSMVIVVGLASILGVGLAGAQSPAGTLTVAVATFGNERWLPHNNSRPWPYCPIRRWRRGNRLADLTLIWL